MAPKPALVFDLFGTLVQEYGDGQWDHLLKGLYTRCVEDHALPAVDGSIEYGQFREAIRSLYRDRYAAAAASTGESPQVRGAVAELLEGFCGQAADDQAVERFIEHYAQAESLLPIHRADEVLATLAGRGYKLALLSNVLFPGWIYEQHLEHLGLKDHLHVWLFSSDQFYMKPHRGIFAVMEAQLQHAPQDCVMVGDRIDLDIVGAQRAGWRTVLIDPKGYGETGGASWVIASLPELLDLFP